MKLIDTHLHLIDTQQFSYPWSSGIPILQDSFMLEDYASIIQGYFIEKALFMEVDVQEGEEFREANFFSDLSLKEDTLLGGVIAKLFPERESFEADLEKLLEKTKLNGLRRVLHILPNEVSQSKRFRDHVALIARYNLSFDLCMTQDQLNLAYELIKACPQVPFILDHLGNPEINPERFADWKASIARIAQLPNVACKISGVIAYGDKESMSLDILRPYMDYALECFSADRLVFGSDWPVCNLGLGLESWLSIFTHWLGALSEAEQNQIGWQNAERIYLQNKKMYA